MLTPRIPHSHPHFFPLAAIPTFSRWFPPIPTFFRQFPSPLFPAQDHILCLADKNSYGKTDFEQHHQGCVWGQCSLPNSAFPSPLFPAQDHILCLADKNSYGKTDFEQHHSGGVGGQCSLPNSAFPSPLFPARRHPHFFPLIPSQKKGKLPKTKMLPLNRDKGVQVCGANAHFRIPHSHPHFFPLAALPTFSRSPSKSGDWNQREKVGMGT
jgi:hypothetical protein